MSDELLRKHRVSIIDATTGDHLHWFDCMAEDCDHALEQAANALCNGESLGVAVVQVG